MPDLKHVAREIFQDALASIDIPSVMQQRIIRDGSRLRVGDWTCDLANFKKIKVIAIGKAAHAMMDGFVRLIPNVSILGVVSAPAPAARPFPGISYFVGGHPLPNEASFAAARSVLTLLRDSSSNDLVVFLLSGGGSALMELPIDPAISLEEMRQLNQLLVTCGASIDEINAVRKHISAVKGGRLALAAAHATQLTLAISDVPLGKESALASGPSVPDPTTVADALAVLDRYRLAPNLPHSVAHFFSSSNLSETPKQSHPSFSQSHFALLLSSRDLLQAAKSATESHGFLAGTDQSTDDWPLDRAADHLLQRLTELHQANLGKPVALIADGELGSRVTGQGIGGRNSAFALACVEKIAGQNIVVLSAGTDGIDGNSPAAGAVADGSTLARSVSIRLSPKDFFDRSDSFTFFQHLDDAILTGPTGNNLRDLRLLLFHP